MPNIITINNKNYTVELDKRGKRQEIVGIIDEYTGDNFAKYVDEYIKELEEKSDEKYWKNHSDEQIYEEELNEMCSLLDELYDYFAEIKNIAIGKYKNMPEWGYIAEEGMDLINKNR